MNEHDGRVKFALTIFAAVLLLGLVALTQPTSGNHGQPVYVDYDAACADLAPPDVTWNELRIAPVQDGTYSNQWLTVTLDIHEGDDDDDDDFGGPRSPDGDDDDESTTIDWTADGGVDGVFVKGGPGGHFYAYTPPANNDWRLTAPPRDDDDDDDDDDIGDGDDDDGYYDPGHVLFCVAAPLQTPTPPQSGTSTPTPTSAPETPTPRPVNRSVYLPSVCRNCSALPDEPNNTCADAHLIQVNTLYEFFPDDANDWYRFQLTAAAELEIRIENFVPLDGQVAAYAGATCETAAFLGSNGDSAPQKILTLGPQPAGTYYIYVSNDGAPNGADPYRLIVEVR